ncbi:hypothetical protein ACQP2T_38210 [Nonomuraea sp. CA-143628]|uniref:hypothetical protein n=1 Tax=Nonomuraea sp. CA-143628 TaxID=3239997 RepID=UPI003D9390AB
MTSDNATSRASHLTYIIDDHSPYGNPEVGLDLATTPGYMLFYSCFMGDVDLAIDGIDFRTHFGWVSTLSFALGMLRSLHELPAKGVSAAGFLESEYRIEFQLNASDVRVSCSYSENVAAIAYSELLALARGGLTELLRNLYAKYPGLVRNPFLANVLAQLDLAEDT